ncbi:hypothetical protein L1987_56309 [Smallanthus sonchifolius]|uniref:Uncharacterized protein n=1 Tax=Smallanthus sonchifolius TaxID=185202 RepID=A0ACB9EBU5_9ASTR|nr:hypothetical protein L1987_56309 [Smallanthus sonchifolius]
MLQRCFQVEWKSGNSKIGLRVEKVKNAKTCGSWLGRSWRSLCWWPTAYATSVPRQEASVAKPARQVKPRCSRKWFQVGL